MPPQGIAHQVGIAGGPEARAGVARVRFSPHVMIVEPAVGYVMFVAGELSVRAERRYHTPITAVVWARTGGPAAANCAVPRGARALGGARLWITSTRSV